MYAKTRGSTMPKIAETPVTPVTPDKTKKKSTAGELYKTGCPHCRADTTAQVSFGNSKPITYCPTCLVTLPTLYTVGYIQDVSRRSY